MRRTHTEKVSMFKHMLWGAVAFWWLQAFGHVVCTEMGLLTYEQNQVITKLLAVELLAAMGIGILVVISILAWLGWDIFIRPRLARLVALLAIIIACIGFDAQAANADLLRTMTKRTVVTAMDSNSITVQAGDSVYTFPPSLLGISVVQGDSIALETVEGEEFGRWNGQILEAWKMTVDVSWILGAIHGRSSNYWEPVDTSMYEFNVCEFSTGKLSTFRLATKAELGDTVAVRTYLSLLLRESQEGDIVVRPDLLHQRRPEIVDHRPYNRNKQK